MTDAFDLADTTERLWKAREQGDVAPAWLVGSLTLEQALDVQLGLLDRKIADGATLAGWKVGLTSERARQALGADERPFGHILASHVFASGDRVAASRLAKPSIEPEMCFTVGRRLSGDGVGRDDVVGAIDRVAAGFELNDRRPSSARPDFCAMVTDCITQWGIVEGGGVAVGDAPDLSGVRCRMFCDGEETYTGVSRDELDDHFDSIARLVHGLTAHGRALEPGQKVITGAFARFDAAAGQTWRAEYEGLGGVEVSFT